MDSGANTASYSAANYLLEGLQEAGIDYLFSNMGTDHAPIIEALAGRKKRNQTLPKVIVCPHENTAAHMAGGYALATGRGQGILVRPYMKWEWALPSGVVVKEALRRAHTVMHSEPKGPVYLMLPRETL